jgi:hypothetical protein
MDSVDKRRTFHAVLLVTRTEEWAIGAETIEEAHELLLSGAGERYGAGERIHVEVERIIE